MSDEKLSVWNDDGAKVGLGCCFPRSEESYELLGPCPHELQQAREFTAGLPDDVNEIWGGVQCTCHPDDFAPTDFDSNGWCVKCGDPCTCHPSPNCPRRRFLDSEMLYIMTQFDSGPGPADPINSAPTLRVANWLLNNWGTDGGECWKVGEERTRYAAMALEPHHADFGRTEEEIEALWDRHCRGEGSNY